MTLVYSEIFGLNRFFTKILQEYLDGYSGYNIVVKISFISDFQSFCWTENSGRGRHLKLIWIWPGHHISFANIEIEALADNRIAVLFVMFSIDLVLMCSRQFERWKQKKRSSILRDVEDFVQSDKSLNCLLDIGIVIFTSNFGVTTILVSYRNDCGKAHDLNFGAYLRLSICHNLHEAMQQICKLRYYA